MYVLPKFSLEKRVDEVKMDSILARLKPNCDVMSNIKFGVLFFTFGKDGAICRSCVVRCANPNTGANCNTQTECYKLVNIKCIIIIVVRALQFQF